MRFHNASSVARALTRPQTVFLALVVFLLTVSSAARAESSGLPRRVFLPYVTVGPPPPHLGYGANIAAADHAALLPNMGFEWAKGFVSWDAVGAGPPYNWVHVDNQLRQFKPHVPNILLRINGPMPAGIGNPIHSPSDLAAFRAFTQALARHVRQAWNPATVAYEILNEPNLSYEWGAAPDPAGYVAVLRAGYEGIKAGDAKAWVVSAGLATGGHYDDLAFIREMYRAGAKPYFDALGSHPYGGSGPPDQKQGPVYFRRAEEQRQVMLEFGDGAKPIWATEFGWIVGTAACNFGYHEWMEVTEAQQAEYLAAAYRYADRFWPWMGPMFIFNLDFATVPWYAYCEQMRWYSIYVPGAAPGTVAPRPAVVALKALPKRSRWR